MELVEVDFLPENGVQSGVLHDSLKELGTVGIDAQCGCYGAVVARRETDVQAAAVVALQSDT